MFRFFILLLIYHLRLYRVTRLAEKDGFVRAYELGGRNTYFAVGRVFTAVACDLSASSAKGFIQRCQLFG